MAANNISVVKDLYQKFALKDYEGIRKIFADKIEWNQMKGFPGGGQYIGADDIFANVFNGFKDNWSSWHAEVEEWLDAGSHIVVIGYYHGVYKLTGKNLKAAFAHRYILENGRIIRFDQYTDTHIIAEAMGVK